MATILPFKSDHRPTRKGRALPTGGAEVIIFPGVRYERAGAGRKAAGGQRSAERRKKR